MEPPHEATSPPRDAETPPPVAVATGPRRWLLLALGLAFVALGTLGAFLPVLPTTPFLLVASACLARSSTTFHERLLANRVFGPYLRQWRHDHTVPRDAKRKGYGLIVVTFTLSIVVVEALWLRVTLALLGLALLALLACLPTSEPEPVPERVRRG